MTTDNEMSATSAETSLRDDLSAAWEESKATSGANEAEDEEQAVDTEDNADKKPEVEDSGAEEKPDEADEEDKKAEEKLVVKAPQSWTPALREKFAELPEDVRAEIMRVENAAGQKFREHAQVRQVAESFANVIKPYEDVIRESGITPVQAIQETFEMAKVLSRGTQRQKAEVIAQLYESYNIDLNELDQVLTQRLSAPKASPTERALLEKLNRLEQKLQPAQAPTVNESANTVNSDIEQFAADPKNEFFNEVSADMVVLLQSGRAETLKDAYNKAVRMNDEVSKVIEDRKAKAAQRVTAGTTSVKGQSPKAAPKAKNENLSLRDLLSKAYDESMEG